MPADQSETHYRARQKHLSRALLAIATIFAIMIAALWIGRQSLADSAVRNELQRRGIRANYQIKAITARWQRIESLRIGDPSNPDLTAEWVDVRLGASLTGLNATTIRAGGVRLRGRIVDGQLKLGDLDTLFSGPAVGRSFEIPDVYIDVSDARARIETTYGQIGVRLDGHGNLRDGFAGKLAAIMPHFVRGGCSAHRATAYLDIEIRRREPHFAGPIRADVLNCGGALAQRSAAMIDATFDAELRKATGTSLVEAEGIVAAGVQLAGVRGRVSVAGEAAKLRGTAGITAQTGMYRRHRVSDLTVDGQFAYDRDWRADAVVRINRFVPDTALIRRTTDVLDAALGTPIEAAAVRLRNAIRTSGDGIKVTGWIAFDGANARLARFAAAGGAGLLLRSEGGTGIIFGPAGWRADTQVLLSGAGLTATEATVATRPDGVMVGLAHIRPVLYPGLRLAFEAVRFAAKPSGAMRIETGIALDGPLGKAGRLEDLKAPIFIDRSASGDLTVNRNCAPVAFTDFRAGSVRMGAGRIDVCPLGREGWFSLRPGRIGGGVAISGPKLRGLIGDLPFILSATRTAWAIASKQLYVDNVDVSIGPEFRRSTIKAASVTGQIAKNGMRGRFGGLAGKLANVPLVIGQSSGAWTLVDGALAVKGAATISDATKIARFNPLRSDDVVLRMANSRIDAAAILREPARNTEIVRVAVVHDLQSSRGSASLEVAGLTFGKQLQPDALTPLTIGVVANVEGTIGGRGEIRWTAAGISSSGRFATQRLNLAAAFGPVSGLKGTIEFNDLLALATPPGQTATVAAINPGTLVTDGVITYRLRPEQRLAIERAAWPFAGGTLILDPTVLETARASDRRLTFRIAGMDAAKFVENLKFENLAASGTFDGVMPMIFDASGGRIEKGHLVARSGGGTVAYVGEVSNAEMNMFGKLAFDALKSMRYQNLSIDLNGPLDGEIVSRVNFSGRNETPLNSPGNFIARQLVGLPFNFNVTIKAPFRSLLNTAKTFQDPTALIQQTLPDAAKTAVQPLESDPKR